VFLVYVDTNHKNLFSKDIIWARLPSNKT